MRVTHAETQAVIDLTDWNADHVLEGAVADDDPRLSDARTPTSHAHDYAAPGHSHDTTHSHTGFAADTHTHDTAHNHDAVYAPVHGHDFASTGHVHDLSHSHTAGEVGAATSGHTHDYADLAHTHAAGEGVPAGVIAMWGGNVNQIPSGWNLCDGTNGTPDLTDRFIRGGSPGSTGGASTHSHTAHSGVISHTHDVAVTDPGHAHVENSNNATTGPLRGWPTPDTSTNTSQATGYSTASATTGLTASASAPSGAVAEVTHDAVSNEPPYYTLAFIQKA